VAQKANFHFWNISQLQLNEVTEVYYKVSLKENFQQQCCSTLIPHFYCAQTAACIKMPVGVELGLGPGDFVLDGDPVAPPQKGIILVKTRRESV